MNLHEYQAKELLECYKILVQRGILARSGEEAHLAFTQLNAQSAVIKAQVHAGGRGKAGGVKLVKSATEASNVASDLLGKNLVTYQTDSLGQPVNSVYVCQDVYPVAKEFYVSMLLDRQFARITLVVSAEGGIDIEEVAKNHPEKIFKLPIDPLIGIQDFQVHLVAKHLAITDKQSLDGLKTLLQGLYLAFHEHDLSMIEINPLALSQSGQLICVDAKITVDDNALFRSKKMLAYRDKTQENQKELRATEAELNYVALEGNIGCMVNGAGLAMATMDIIKLYGGQPANFLDVGGSATFERVVEALRIILEDKSIVAVLINIFGGIVRCDMVAEAIIAATKELKTNIPIVVRLEGNRADIGAKMLNESGMKLTSANGLVEAATKVVSFV